MELTGQDAVARWRATLGPTDSSVARTDTPNSIRALFGTDKQANAAHGSDSELSATRVSVSRVLLYQKGVKVTIIGYFSVLQGKY